MAKKASAKINMPSSIMLILLLLLAALVACILTPIIAFVISRLFDIKSNSGAVLVNSTLVIYLILCIFFRGSLKSDIRSSLNLPFYTVLLHFIIGIVVAFLFICVAVGIVWIFGIKNVDISIPKYIWSFIFISLVAGFLSEMLFRGFVLQSLVPEIRTFPAVILSSAFFALFRLIDTAGKAVNTGGSFDFLSGFKAFPHIFSHFNNFEEKLPEVAGFFLIGALLALAYLKLGSLYAPAGISAFLLFIDSSASISLNDRLFVGKDIIFGSHGTILETLPGGIMSWILLLLAIIGFLSIGGINSKQEH